MSDYLIVPLTKNRHTIIDAEDYERIAPYKWHVNDLTRVHYAMTTVYDGGKRPLQMHRLVMDAPKGVQVDHINGDGLDNRKENLRLCTHAENMRNGKRQRNNTTGYIGITAKKDVNGYIAQISVSGKNKYLAKCLCPIEAAIFRDIAALELHGAFARLNFPELRGLFLLHT